ncbi:MAG: signal peptide peptidase SppA [Bacteroidales bacterium]
MKNFFKIVFASMLGYILLALIMFIVGLSLIASLSSDPEVSIKPNSILELTLDQVIPDRANTNPFENINFMSMKMDQSIGLNDILTYIAKAKKDDNIKGIYLNLGGCQAGTATAQEIRNALRDFKTSGKFIYAYSEMYGQSAYYIASVADKVFLHREGSIDFQGLELQVTLFKNLLDKLGVEMQVVRHGKFKSAVEPYLDTKISPANREQLSILSQSVWNSLLQDIATDRKISITQLNTIADSLLALFPEDALRTKMVDTLVIRQNVIDILMRKVGVDKEKDLNLVALTKYIKTEKETIKTENKIAVIYAQGEIGVGKGTDNEIGTENISKAIRQAVEDEDVKAIVLRVNSPGGSVLTSELIYNEVLLAKNKKPVIASYGNYAASGGYYISCGCTKIIADPTTLTGSIGVFGVIPNAQKLLTDKVGLNFDRVVTNKNAGFISGVRPMSAYEKMVMQKNIEKIYANFIGKVAKGRNMTLAQVDSIAQGRVWSGIDAKRIGLVDEFGGLQYAIAQAAKMVKLDQYRIKEYPKQKDSFSQLMETFGEAKAHTIESELGEYKEVYQVVKQLQKSKGVQARLPYLLNIQ